MSLSRREVLADGLLLSSALGCRRLDVLRLAPSGGTPVIGPLWPEEPYAGPFAAPVSIAIDPIRHVLNRLSFGPRPEDEALVRALATDPTAAIETFIDQQLDPENIDDPLAVRAVRRLETLSQPAGELFEYQPQVLLDELTSGTLLRAVYSRRQLYEVMVQFWTDHFNIDASKGDCKWLKAADDRDVIRRHALGRFGDLLRASALSPAMLWYLDGRVNRKRDEAEMPNENYARELLELHTLGVDGGYSQHDVMEVARCLTGWTVRSEQLFGKGKVEFSPGLHDDGEKRVLGRQVPAGQGERDLDHVLDAVVNHPRTAHHLARKLCQRFISEAPAAQAIEDVAAAFASSGGDIQHTLRAVFATEAFRASAGLKIKRPFRFVVSALRATDARTDGGKRLQNFLLSMGHAPFQYPTPDGYPEDGTPWLGTLLWRWSFAVSLASGHITGTAIDLDGLRNVFGDTGLQAHLLGHLPRREEVAGDGSPATELALTIASPPFQRY